MVPELHKTILISVWMGINFVFVTAEIFLLNSGCELKNVK
jgi:hypothetical protein